MVIYTEDSEGAEKMQGTQARRSRRLHGSDLNLALCVLRDLCVKKRLSG
jgi:hypothetical protein